MFRVTRLVHSAAVCAVLIAASQSAHADHLKAGGTGSANEMVNIVARAWTTAQEGASVEIVPGLGSSGAIAAVADGALDIALSGRILKDDERAQGLVALPLAKTPFVFATSQAAVGPLRGAELPTFYSSPSATWSNGAPVRAIIRPRNESDTQLLVGFLPNMAGALDALRARGDVPIAATDQDNLDLAEKVPGSIVAAALAQIVNEKRNLRIVAIDGVAPSLASLEAGSYPFAKTFYVVTKAEPSPSVRALLQFLTTPAGRTALRAAGTLPIQD